MNVLGFKLQCLEKLLKTLLRFLHVTTHNF